MSDDNDPSTQENYHGYTFDDEHQLCESSIYQQEEVTLSKNTKTLEDDKASCNNVRKPDATKKNKTKKNKKNKKKQHQHSLEHLSQRITELMKTLDQRGIAVPLPDSTSHKTWSNRNYGGDKKRQRKQAEREFLLARIQQLEMCCPPPQKHHHHHDDDNSGTHDEL
mmetsp:Transcript_14669/g.22914  ORF Transcript_14669/g.22914 Transcript_14669/m.22914 type:complete len:166 (-) Transcript_14669:2573-3070(-)